MVDNYIGDAKLSNRPQRPDLKNRRQRCFLLLILLSRLLFRRLEFKEIYMKIQNYSAKLTTYCGRNTQELHHQGQQA